MDCALILNEKHSLKTLNFIFCTDEYLHSINLQYLNHDTYTDIITFDNSEGDGLIEGDIFISIDRVKENANKFDVSLEKEIKRVMAHGVLHLCGYIDKTAGEAKQMRLKEDEALDISLKYIS